MIKNSTSLNRPKVLVRAQLTPSAIEKLESIAEVYLNPDIDAEELNHRIADFDAIVCHGPERLYTTQFFEAASRLKILARTSVGTDMVDIAAATDHGVLVTNAPGTNAISVAEQGILLMLAISRRLVLCHQKVCSGEPFRRADIYQALQGFEIYGKTMGLIGYGAVGRQLSKRAIAMDVHVNAFDPFVNIDLMKADGVNPTSVEKLLSVSDYVLLCCPLTDETRGMMNKQTLQQMKPDAYLINIARGALVVSSDLCEVLKTGQIAGAALDVSDPEPPLKNDPLLKFENVIFSAHQGGNTKECWERMCHTAVNNALQYFKGESPDNLINRNVLSDSD
ncbi:MAG: hydroxyacid dehydrogenase [Desulfobacterales bacterium]|nr:hydroxyacid dehydrogenase [Desulfobacterales bacterium]